MALYSFLRCKESSGGRETGTLGFCSLSVNEFHDPWDKI